MKAHRKGFKLDPNGKILQSPLLAHMRKVAYSPIQEIKDTKEEDALAKAEAKRLRKQQKRVVME